jgi:hypothetical protein
MLGPAKWMGMPSEVHQVSAIGKSTTQIARSQTASPPSGADGYFVPPSLA